MEALVQAHNAGGSVIDPVCGMTVDATTSPHRYIHNGHDYAFCSAGCRGKFAADPKKYLGEEAAAPGRAGARGCDLYLPDASGSPPAGTGHLPYLRHGARARSRRRRRRRRARRYDTALLGVGGAGAASARAGDGRAFRICAAAARRLGNRAARPGDTGGAVGRLAVLCARHPIAAHAPSQYVHADRHGHRRRLRLQLGGGAGARIVSAGVPRRARRHRALFRGRRDNHRAGAARAGLGTARPRLSLERDPRADDADAQQRAARAAGRRRRGRAARRRRGRQLDPRSPGRTGAGRRRPGRGKIVDR